MNYRKLFLVLTALVLATLSCRLFIPGTPTPEPPPITDAPETSEPQSGTVDMAAKLAELGGEACEENPDFTCVSIQAKFGPSATRHLTNG